MSTTTPMDPIIHCASLEEWRGALDKLFKMGHTWASGERIYLEKYYYEGRKGMGVDKDGDIRWATKNWTITARDFIGPRKIKISKEDLADLCIGVDEK